LLRLAATDLRGMDAAGASLFKARLARRSAASRLSSACLVETAAICAARRWAELGRWFVGATDTVMLFLAAIGVSLLPSL
jgi:cyanate permease